MPLQSQYIITLIKNKISLSSRKHLEQRKTSDKKYIDLIILVINPFETF
jgi:hypothetical protein